MKKFIDKKVLDFKFRKAGEGHALSEEKHPSPAAHKTPSDSQQKSSRASPSQSSRAAGGAALARLETGSSSSSSAGHHTQGGGGKRRVACQGGGGGGGGGGGRGGGGGGGGGGVGGGAAVVKTPKQAVTPPTTSAVAGREREVVVTLDTASRSVVVHVVCPLCQRSVPHGALHDHLAACLQEEYLREPLSASVQMVHTLCREQDRRKLCVDTIAKYLDNVLEHPGEDKFCRVRVANKAYQERVASVQGAALFLEAVGFQQRLLPHQDGEEQFLVLPSERAGKAEELEVCKELLTSGQPLKIAVDRNLQVFRPSSRATHFTLPDDFYHLTLDEVKKEQKARSEVLERDQVLRTRAVREREELKMAARHYRFTLLRVRLHDGLILQSVFRPLEKLSEVRLLISDALSDPAHTFSLSALGKPLHNDQLSLAQLGLVPSAVLNFSWEGSGPVPSSPFLKQDLLARIQDLA